jgi:hypothetical protein
MEFAELLCWLQYQAPIPQSHLGQPWIDLSSWLSGRMLRLEIGPSAIVFSCYRRFSSTSGFPYHTRGQKEWLGTVDSSRLL